MHSGFRPAAFFSIPCFLGVISTQTAIVSGHITLGYIYIGYRSATQLMRGGNIMSPRVIRDPGSDAYWAGWTALLTVLVLIVIAIVVYFLWYNPTEQGRQATNIRVNVPQAPQQQPSAPPNVNVNVPPPPEKGAGPAQQPEKPSNQEKPSQTQNQGSSGQGSSGQGSGGS